MVIAFAMLGSVLGARKENKEPLKGITQEDVSIMQQQDANAPILTGILPLAENQNNWDNFKWAILFSGIGIVFYCILMALYMPLYDIRFFKWIRRLLKEEEAEENLFIRVS